MTSTHGDSDSKPATQTLNDIVTGLTYVCPRCGFESDGFTRCLHTRDSEGKEQTRCLSCYRAYVQSEEHLGNIAKNIPELVLKPKDAA